MTFERCSFNIEIKRCLRHGDLYDRIDRKKVEIVSKGKLFSLRQNRTEVSFLVLIDLLTLLYPDLRLRFRFAAQKATLKSRTTVGQVGMFIKNIYSTCLLISSPIPRLMNTARGLCCKNYIALKGQVNKALIHNLNQFMSLYNTK